jgi:UMF1 family MFS transporter
MNEKLTGQERSWVLYDVANSAFTMMVSTMIPLFFNALAANADISSVSYLAFWGYAASVSTLIVAFSGPLIGTLSDFKGMKKKLFALSILLGGTGCMIMGFIRQWLLFLLIYIAARICYSLSLIIYDSMLPDITADSRMDSISSSGYAWGYIGSCIPFIISLLLVLFSGKIGLSHLNALALAFVITGLWWGAVSLPLIRSYQQKHYQEKERIQLHTTITGLAGSLRDISRDRHIYLFLLAFFFYIDGVYTIIEMATAYGSALGLDSTGLLIALLVTQFVAFPSCILIGRLARHISSATLISICIIAYFCIALYGATLHDQYQFWILAITVGLFQGGIQALSRSYFARIIPPEKSGEYFGIMDICGKGASFMGTMIVSLVSQLTGNVNYGVGAISVTFIIGFILFRMSVRTGHIQVIAPLKKTA